MGKTIPNLTALNATPDDSDLLVIDDSGVTKRITAGNLKGDCIRTVSDVVAIPDGDNIQLGTVTGTKIGTATSQKLAFYNATPVDQPAVTADLLDSLQEVGLIASGAGDTPLNLTNGALTAGASTLASLTVAGTTALQGAISITDGQNIAIATTTGTKIGTGADQRIGFFNATPVAQPETTDTVDGYTQGATGGTNSVQRASTFTGDFGTRAYTIGDVVRALKEVGLLRKDNP